MRRPGQPVRYMIELSPALAAALVAMAQARGDEVEDVIVDAVALLVDEEIGDCREAPATGRAL